MTFDSEIFARNQAATQRMRALADRADGALSTRVGEHWTMAVMFAHLAFWDRRVLFALEKSMQDGRLFVHQADQHVNDYVLPLLEAIPAHEAVRLALEAAEALDRRLVECPAALLEEIYQFNPRWVERALHRNEHVAEAEQALGG